MRSTVAGQRKLQWLTDRNHWGWSSYKYTRSCWRTMSIILQLFGISSKLERWKSSVSWADRKSKQSFFWSVIFSYSMQQQWIIPPSDHDVRPKVDFIWQLAMTSSVAGPRRSSKAQVTFGWSAAHLIHYSFLNPSETITSEKYAQQIDEMHRKLQCLQPALIKRKGPMLPHYKTWSLQKLNKLGYEVLPHLPYSPNLSPTDYHFFKHLENFL